MGRVLIGGLPLAELLLPLLIVLWSSRWRSASFVGVFVRARHQKPIAIAPHLVRLSLGTLVFAIVVQAETDQRDKEFLLNICSSNPYMVHCPVEPFPNGTTGQWTRGTDPCEDGWMFIECDANNRRVTRISLVRSLDGECASETCDMRDTSYGVGLSANKFGSMRSMMSMSDAPMSVFPDEVIPGALEGLVLMELMGIGLATLPESFCQVYKSADTVVDVSKNALTGLPACTNMTGTVGMLNFVDNNMLRLPASVSLIWQGLTHLDLSNTWANGLADFGALPYADVVRELRHRGNSVSELPGDLCMLQSLVYLAATGNSLSKLPDCFSDMLSLEVALLYANRLSSLPVMSKLENCKSMALADNLFEGSVTECQQRYDCFSGCGCEIEAPVCEDPPCEAELKGSFPSCCGDWSSSEKRGVWSWTANDGMSLQAEAPPSCDVDISTDGTSLCLTDFGCVEERRVDSSTHPARYIFNCSGSIPSRTCDAHYECESPYQSPFFFPKIDGVICAAGFREVSGDCEVCTMKPDEVASSLVSTVLLILGCIALVVIIIYKMSATHWHPAGKDDIQAMVYYGRCQSGHTAAAKWTNHITSRMACAPNSVHLDHVGQEKEIGDEVVISGLTGDKEYEFNGTRIAWNGRSGVVTELAEDRADGRHLVVFSTMGIRRPVDPENLMLAPFSPEPGALLPA